MDTTIPAIATIVTQIDQLITNFLKGLLSGSGGTGTFSQILNSIVGVADSIMIGFLGAGITGFIVLIL
jgi:hypothetical protein